jgi:hypothetical protein
MPMLVHILNALFAEFIQTFYTIVQYCTQNYKSEKKVVSLFTYYIHFLTQ